MKNNIVKLAIFLAVVSALAGGALAWANNLTAPIIEANNEKAEKEVLQQMYPKASLDDFKPVEYTGDNASIDTIYQYGDIYVVKMTVKGYDGGSVFLVGIDQKDDKIDAFQVISNGDTKGIGSKVTEEPFKKSLVGKNAADKLDTISGATYSSTPIVEGINQAAEIVNSMKGGN